MRPAPLRSSPARAGSPSSSKRRARRRLAATAYPCASTSAIGASSGSALLVDDSVPGVLPALVVETRRAIGSRYSRAHRGRGRRTRRSSAALPRPVAAALETAPASRSSRRARTAGRGTAEWRRSCRSTPPAASAPGLPARRGAAHVAPCRAPRRARHRPSCPAVPRAVAGSPRPSLDRTRASGARR